MCVYDGGWGVKVGVRFDFKYFFPAKQAYKLNGYWYTFKGSNSASSILPTFLPFSMEVDCKGKTLLLNEQFFLPFL